LKKIRQPRGITHQEEKEWLKYCNDSLNHHIIDYVSSCHRNEALPDEFLHSDKFQNAGSIGGNTSARYLSGADFSVGTKGSINSRMRVAAETATKTSSRNDGFFIDDLNGDTRKRLRKKRLKPEARIDLHGLTVSNAEAAVRDFVYTCYEEERRLILIVAGLGKKNCQSRYKNKFSDDRFSDNEFLRTGIINRELPLWLSHSTMRKYISGLSNATKACGGEGAFFVYLRKFSE
jgi:DNA-nicking Smr family endonuclease